MCSIVVSFFVEQEAEGLRVRGKCGGRCGTCSHEEYGGLTIELSEGKRIIEIIENGFLMFMSIPDPADARFPLIPQFGMLL